MFNNILIYRDVSCNCYIVMLIAKLMRNSFSFDRSFEIETIVLRYLTWEKKFEIYRNVDERAQAFCPRSQIPCYSDSIHDASDCAPTNFIA